MGEENVLLFGREKKKKKKKKMWNTITSKNNPKYKKIIVLVDCNRFVSLRKKKGTGTYGLYLEKSTYYHPSLPK